MKKLFAILLALALCLAVTACGKTEEAPAGTDVTVTIVDMGLPVVPAETVSVTDQDSDGTLTIYDALACAHAQYSSGGAAAFAAEETEYGLSMTRLWGIENGGSYGYYLNHASPMSLLDPVSAGDTVTAYSYSDLENWSDVYAWFEGSCGDGTAELTLYAQQFDENWNPVTAPVAGAEIFVNDSPTGLVTDDAGRVSVPFTDADATGHNGRILITAASDEMVLVTPVFRAK